MEKLSEKEMDAIKGGGYWYWNAEEQKWYWVETLDLGDA